MSSNNVLIWVSRLQVTPSSAGGKFRAPRSFVVAVPPAKFASPYGDMYFTHCSVAVEIDHIGVAINLVAAILPPVKITSQ